MTVFNLCCAVAMPERFVLKRKRTPFLDGIYHEKKIIKKRKEGGLPCELAQVSLFMKKMIMIILNF